MKLIISTLLLFLPILVFCQKIKITEISSKGTACVKDCYGEYCDWIELYNYGSDTINCIGLSICDDITSAQKFKLPDTVITPQGFLLVYATGNNSVANNEIHTDFKLSSNGENVYVLNSRDSILDNIGFPEMQFNQSFGKVSLSNNELVLYDKPTPGENNNNSTNIIFSKQGGFYDSGVSINITAENNDTVYYTLDGSDPNPSSKFITSPLILPERTQNTLSQIPTTPLEGKDYMDYFVWLPPLNEKSTGYSLKCQSFRNGIPTSKIYTNTYIIDSDIDDLLDFPVFSITADSIDMFSYEKGIFVPGKLFDETPWNGWWPYGNYRTKEYIDINIEYFTETGKTIFNSPALMKVRGYGSASHSQKSVKISFKNSIGSSTKGNDIYQKNDNLDYKTFVLRNGGNDFRNTHFSDAFEQELLKNTGLETLDSKPSHVYINGEYWGIYNIRESYDDEYFKRHFNLNEEELIIVTACGTKVKGDNSSYQSLMKFMSENSLEDSKNYNKVKEQIDIDNCIDYYIAQIYVANVDWPGNNVKIWKTIETDSKWRFLVYDLDISWAYDSRCTYERNHFEHAAKSDATGWPYPPCSTFLFRSLIKSSEFTEQFISRFKYHLENTFEVNHVLNTIDSFEAEYENQIQHHIDRWSYPKDYQKWKKNVEDLREFARHRPCVIKSQIIEFFDIEEFDFECDVTNIENEESPNISISPIPANGFVHIKTEAPIENIIVSTLSGQEVIIKIPQQNSYNLNLSGIQSGVYFVSIKTGNCIITRKLIVQK